MLSNAGPCSTFPALFPSFFIRESRPDSTPPEQMPRSIPMVATLALKPELIGSLIWGVLQSLQAMLSIFANGVTLAKESGAKNPQPEEPNPLGASGTQFG